MEDPNTKRLRELAPKDEIALYILEAVASVEADLALEDEGWINLSGASPDVITPAERITNLQLSRLYAAKDPLGKQSIRLWTDYTFGTGMVWETEDEPAKKVLEDYWGAPTNQPLLSARGQRKSSDMLLIDGEVFFALFLGAGGIATIRHIDPLEITEIITDLDDREDVKFYRRQWSDVQGTVHEAVYRSTTNIKDDPAVDMFGRTVKSTDDALVYHLTYNTITQRGNPLLLPALTWMKYYNKFLSSRIAVMLALAKFAWRSKVKGGQVATDAIKAKTHGVDIPAGSQLVENMGVDTTPIKTETGASAAKEDADMIKLQVCAAVGWPTQYFGDISTGNLATAKTVELPVTKMCQSYQSVWNDAYQDIDEVVLAYNKIDFSKVHIDRVFPTIAPENYVDMAASIQQILQVLPELATSDDVVAQALLSIGVNDPAAVLEELTKEAKVNPSIPLARALKQFREILKVKE